MSFVHIIIYLFSYNNFFPTISSRFIRKMTRCIYYIPHPDNIIYSTSRIFP